LVKSGQWSKRWDAVIVDEAQDLTPTALALCVELCRNPQGLFLTADASQSLYNRGFRWKDVHEKLQIVGRTRILKKNYRSSQQIAEAASEILRDTGAGDEEVLDQVYVHTGPRPTIHTCDDKTDHLLKLVVEIEEAAKELRLPIGAAAILTRTRELAKDIANDLNDWDLPARYMTSKRLDLKCPQVKVLTIHSAKGLEFPIVALPFVEKGILPYDLESAQAEDLKQHLDAERRLFFVGCTRSMRRLIVTYRENHGSPFLNDLSHDTWRWT
jgi:superfamily I DNA/RNA helicase